MAAAALAKGCISCVDVKSWAEVTLSLPDTACGSLLFPFRIAGKSKIKPGNIMSLEYS